MPAHTEHCTSVQSVLNYPYNSMTSSLITAHLNYKATYMSMDQHTAECHMAVN